MTSSTEDGSEAGVLGAVRDLSASREQVATSIEALPPGSCSLARSWSEIVADESLEAWRRLAAYGVLVSRCIRYPAALDDVVRIALEPFGLSKEQLVDGTMLQNVPLERAPSNQLLTATLPIETSVGRATFYMAVGEGGTVARAAVYPVTD